MSFKSIKSSLNIALTVAIFTSGSGTAFFGVLILVVENMWKSLATAFLRAAHFLCLGGSYKEYLVQWGLTLTL